MTANSHSSAGAHPVRSGARAPMTVDVVIAAWYGNDAVTRDFWRVFVCAESRT